MQVLAPQQFRAASVRTRRATTTSAGMHASAPCKRALHESAPRRAVPPHTATRAMLPPGHRCSSMSGRGVAVTTRLRAAAGVAMPPRAAARGGGRRGGAVAVEANLLSRLARVVRAYVSNFTSSLEDPETLLDRCVEEMQEDLVKMRQATARVMGSERQMAARAAAAGATADEWMRRAELAVRKGQDELAREALARRKATAEGAAAQQAQVDAQRRALEQLQANVRVLEAKLGEARSKRETLKARAATARSSKQVQEMVAGLRMNTSTAWAAFDRMEDKVAALEAESESAALFATPDSLERRFTQLEANGGVDDELEALKRGLRLPVERRAAVGALPPGRPLEEALELDGELQALRKRARA